MARAVRLAPPYVLAMLPDEGGGGREKCGGGRHGAYVPAPFAQA